MKTIKYIFTIAVMIGLTAFVVVHVIPQGDTGHSIKQNNTSNAPAEGDSVPSFRLRDISGADKSLSDYKDKLILVNFWASWCGPCNEEAGSLESMYTKLRPEGVVVVAVSIDHHKKEVMSFVKKYSITFPVLMDPDENVASDYAITGVPETFILTPDYKLIKHIIGPLNWTSDNVMDYLKTLIGEGK
jgi:peroxiredoxin